MTLNLSQNNMIAISVIIVAVISLLVYFFMFHEKNLFVADGTATLGTTGSISASVEDTGGPLPTIEGGGVVQPPAATKSIAYSTEPSGSMNIALNSFSNTLSATPNTPPFAVINTPYTDAPVTGTESSDGTVPTAPVGSAFANVPTFIENTTGAVAAGTQANYYQSIFPSTTDDAGGTSTILLPDPNQTSAAAAAAAAEAAAKGGTLRYEYNTQSKPMYHAGGELMMHHPRGSETKKSYRARMPETKKSHRAHQGAYELAQQKLRFMPA